MCCVLLAAGKQDLTSSFPSFLFHTSACEDSPVLLWKTLHEAHCKKQSEFFLEAQEGYQSQNCSALLIPPATHTPALSSPCTGKLRGKKRRLSHEVIPLSHFYSSAFSRCLQLSLLYSCTWLLRLWSSPLLHILWCILAYIVCNLTPCHLIPPTSHNPYQPLSPPFHLSFV